MIDLIHTGTMRETCQSHGCAGCLTTVNVTRVLATPLVHEMIGRAALAQWQSRDRVNGADYAHIAHNTWRSAICYVVADMVGLGVHGLFQNLVAETLIRDLAQEAIDARSTLFDSVDA
jgi:hypothetical protein